VNIERYDPPLLGRDSPLVLGHGGPVDTLGEAEESDGFQHLLLLLLLKPHHSVFLNEHRTDTQALSMYWIISHVIQVVAKSVREKVVDFQPKRFWVRSPKSRV